MQNTQTFVFHRWERFLEKYRFPIAMALGLRLGLSLWLGLIWMIVDRYFPQSERLVREVYGRIEPSPNLLGRALLDVWLRWDATHYMNIAIDGYSGVGVGDLNFPPLYPNLVLLLKPLAFGNEILSGLIVSTVSSLVAFVLLHKFVEETFQDTALANQTILVFGIYPTSFFLFAPFTDALFIAISLAFFILVRFRRWIWAGLAIVIASFARLQAVLLMLPLVIEIGRSKSLAPSRQNLPAYFSVGIAPLGYLLFSLWRRANGLPAFSDTFSQYSKIVFVDPLTGLWLAIRQVIELREGLVISELLSVLLFLFITLWMFFQPKFRRHWPMLVYSLALILLFMTKHSTAASALQSSNRYVLGAFPVFIGLAEIVLRMSKWKRMLFHLGSLALLMIASALYALFIFVG